MNKLLTFIVVSSIIFSCSNNPKNTNKEDIENTKKEIIETKKDIEPANTKTGEKTVVIQRNIEDDRKTAKKEINERMANNPEVWEPLVLNYYMVDFLSEGQSAPADIIDLGEWYKFDKNFRYEHGYFDKISEKGKYTIDLTNKTLLMLPDQEDKLPSEWKLLNSADVIVMVGTSKFGNNPVQKHMQNVLKKPEIIK